MQPPFPQVQTLLSEVRAAGSGNKETLSDSFSRPPIHNFASASLCAVGIAGLRRFDARRSPMDKLPARANLDYLKKQAKDLIRLY
jgi:hypothetical protein